MSLPRLLAGAHADRPLSLAEHLALHGQSPRGGSQLIERVEHAGLRGRGGASFPAAVKLRSVAKRRGPRALLVNAAEGDPMSAKDRVLLELVPHLVLDGALAAAAAIGAGPVVVAIPDDAAAARSALETALRERGGVRAVSIADVPVAYLAGEETALIAFLDGRPLRPTTAPPRPFERGLRRRPTLVQNPETLAHIALIDRHGPAWFRQVGTRDHPGSALITVTGAVGLPGVQEIACGATLSSVLAAAGGSPEPLRAVLVGGCHGVWIAGDELETVTLDDVGLAEPRRRPRRGRHRRARPIGVPRAGARPRDRLPRRAERGPVRTVQQRPAGDRGAPHRGGRRASAPGRTSPAGALEPGSPRAWRLPPARRRGARPPQRDARLRPRARRPRARPVPRLPAGADAGAAVNPHLHIDPIACDGRGLCAELFPEWIALDDWGYPIVDHGPIPEQLLVHARRAVEACPKLALTLKDDDSLRHPRKP